MTPLASLKSDEGVQTTGNMTKAPWTPPSARAMLSCVAPITVDQFDALGRPAGRLCCGPGPSARTGLPCASRCLAVAPPTCPVIPMTKNMLVHLKPEGLQLRQGLI